MHSVKLERHRPVLLSEVIDFIAISEHGQFADFTLGDGGHTDAILNQRKNARLIAFDRDGDAITRYKQEGLYRESDRLQLVHARFSEASAFIAPNTLDGALVDLGVSTRQLMDKQRGFSMNEPGPLDMRMGKPGQEALCAQPSCDNAEASLLEILSAISLDALCEALQVNTDMRNARTIAMRVLGAFHANQLKTTQDLAGLMGPKKGKNHPATVLFLALRMLVNKELDEVRSIPKLIPLLKPGGRLAVITFHSTEDRLVKRLFRELAGLCICGKGLLCQCQKIKTVHLLTKKPVVPQAKEIFENPRSRSAKLRVIERLGELE